MECCPIYTLKEALEWKAPHQQLHTEKLRKRMKAKNSSKVLLCHDMQGGYLDDRHIQGTENIENYRFFHWSNIDIFVYFSHHFVTIPPAVWITAAHRNGTPILGTLITEWDEGKDFCKMLFETSKSYSLLACQLAAMARFYGFDGWLINIENTIEDTEKLADFIYLLTTVMHTFIPNSLVIMYDSVITTGELKWQNELNELNRCFFDACDGLFLNYNWKENNLKNSALQAAQRKSDVYVGVDVFGRGCLGGGGFNTRVAVKAAIDSGLSIAIFAPGWVFETQKGNFLDNQYKFWRLLNELCPVHGPAELPFVTSFCQGFGKKFYRKGKVISEKTWYNLSLQQIQPTHHWEEGSAENGFTKHFADDAYEYGGCLQMWNIERINGGSQCFRLFASYFQLTTSVQVSYTFKPVSPNINVILILEVEKSENSHRVYLVQQESPESYEPYKKISKQDHIILFPLNNEGESSAEDGWITRNYVLSGTEFCNSTIKNIFAEISNSTAMPNIPYYALLGQIKIVPLKDCCGLQCNNLVKECPCDGQLSSVNCLLQWDMSTMAAENCWDIFCCIDNEKFYVGTTCENFYMIDKYKLPEVAHNQKNMKFCAVNYNCGESNILSAEVPI